ncbi:MAG: STAS domain-containing protein [Planctomycetota bacterium]
MKFEIETAREEGLVAVVVKGRLDASSSHRFGEVISHALNEPTAWVLIDASELSYISSDGLRYLVSTSKRVSRQIVVAGATPRVREVFKLTGLVRLISLCDAMADAHQIIASTPKPQASASLTQDA